jgi:hypothetical protein
MVFFSSSLSSALMSLPSAASSSSLKVARTSSLTACDAVHAGELVGVVDRRAHLVGAGREDALAQSLVDRVDRHVHRGDIGLGDEPLLDRAELGDGLLGEGERCEHVVLGDLVRAGLDHVDRVGRAGDHEIEIGVLELVEGRVHQNSPSTRGDADAGERALERDSRQPSAQPRRP